MISIIIPVFNSEKTILSTVESVRNQGFENWELILVNDGSTDRSLELCTECERKDPRIKVVDKENGGVSSARNAGLEVAKGEWIEFIDSDDLLLPKERCLNLNEYADIDLIVFGYEKKSNGKHIKTTNSKKVYGSRTEVIHDAAQLLKNGFFNPVWNKLYKRRMITAYFDEQCSLGEDLLFNIAFLSNIERIMLIPDVWYRYTDINEDSLTHKYNKNIVENQKELREALLTWNNESTFETEVNRIAVVNIINSMQLVVYDRQLSKAEKQKILSKWIEQTQMMFIKEKLDLRTFTGFQKMVLNFVYSYKPKEIVSLYETKRVIANIAKMGKRYGKRD
jgi:glycosyltransferase involved in cell wall biosynthesis